MNLKQIKVYHLFWIVSILIVIIGIIQSRDPNAFLDINIHDTYFVIRNSDCTLFLFLTYFLMGLGYWLVLKTFKKELVKPLTIIHSVILLGSFIFYWIIYWIDFYTEKTVIDPNFTLLYDSALPNTTLVVAFLLIFFVATPLYITNLVLAFLWRR